MPSRTLFSGGRSWPNFPLNPTACGPLVAAASFTGDGGPKISNPFTRLLWALRDADRPEEHWATALGERVLADGEPHLWNELTAVRA